MNSQGMMPFLYTLQAYITGFARPWNHPLWQRFLEIYHSAMKTPEIINKVWILGKEKSSAQQFQLHVKKLRIYKGVEVFHFNPCVTNIAFEYEFSHLDLEVIDENSQFWA